MKKLRIGLIIDVSFHLRDRWVVALTPELIRGLLHRFDCRIIWNQDEYVRKRDEVDALISMDPGWAAPKLNLRRRRGPGPTEPPLTYVMISDPHDRLWRQDYVLAYDRAYILALYDRPTRRHFAKMPAERIVYFPWAVPDSWIDADPISFRERPKIACFGAAGGDAYTIRNWCREFDFVDASTHSGVEDKQLVGKAYIDWLAEKDAAIAAGSDDVKYRLTMPKYFEIPAAGALLFAQETDDLETNGFVDGENCIVFTRGDFESLARTYLADPRSYLPIREAGRELIRQRHTITRRLDFLEQHIRENLKTSPNGQAAG